MTAGEMSILIIERYPRMIEPQIYEESPNNYTIKTYLPPSSENKLNVLRRGKTRMMSTSFEFNEDGSISFKFKNIGDTFPLLDTILK